MYYLYYCLKLVLYVVVLNYLSFAYRVVVCDDSLITLKLCDIHGSNLMLC